MRGGSSVALRGSWIGALLRFWNPVMKRLLRSPLHWPWSRWFLVVSWTGRRTGRRYATPVSYAPVGDVLLVTTGDRWWRNLAGGGPVTIWLRGRRRQATATPVLDEDASVAGHRALFAGRPLFRLLARLPRPDRGMSPDEAIRETIRNGRVLVRLEPGKD
jgi:hypothetical protein